MSRSRRAPEPAVGTPEVGERFTVDVGAVAHGGHCVARHDGRVVFVRHTLPGERVVVEVTGHGSGGRFLLADAVEILVASADRRPAPCSFSGPGRCGGCDWQHVTPEAQRGLKAAVVAEAMRRQGGIEAAPEVELVPGDDDGLRWRTRATFAIDSSGRAGFHRHRSHEVVPVTECLLVTPLVDASDVTRRTWPGSTSVSVVGTSTGKLAVSVEPPLSTEASRALAATLPEGAVVAGDGASSRLHERVGDHEYLVAAGAFWQVHPGAPQVLVSAVVDALNPRAGDHVVDLYSGVGLFGIAMAPLLGPGGRVDMVESDQRACSAARRTVHATPTVRVHEERVDRWLATSAPRRCDLVVLDPPEAGASKGVLDRLVRMRPRAVAYVSCDPAALGRDVALLAGLGWQLTGLRAFDLFPTTHHVECVATFAPQSGAESVVR